MQLVSLCTTLFISLSLITTFPMYEFGKNKAGQDWYAVNDGVMGGRSDGTLTLKKDCLHFEGEVSLENNGGFASFRCPYGKFNLSNYKSVQIRYKSTGFDFAFVLENKQVYYEPNYKHKLPNTQGEWTVAILHLNEFEGYKLGNPINEKLSKEIQSEIIRMGFISNEKKAGDFELCIDYIKFE